MTPVLLLDREGVEVAVDIKVLALAGSISVFISDKQTSTAGSISRNAAAYLVQLVRRLGLHPVSTHFYRHVYNPQQGSLFGRFDIVWQDAELVSYKFVMLNNLDEGKQLREWIVKATVVPITYGQTRNLEPAVSRDLVEVAPASGYQ